MATWERCERVEAVVYQPGMEDGVALMGDNLTGFVWSGYSKQAVRPGDYIVTYDGDGGARHVWPADKFEAAFTRVAEPAPAPEPAS